MFRCSDPPEIELETNRVHSGINKEAHLTCRVQGNPEPIVSIINNNIYYLHSNLQCDFGHFCHFQNCCMVYVSL